LDDIDFWRSAKLLIDQHGSDTRVVAAMRSDEMLECGISKARRVWNKTKIMEAVIAMTDQVRVFGPSKRLPKDQP
jgi:hypothetical protein